MISAYILFGVAVVLVVLGFVALLKQKTYLDAATQKPVDIEVPLLGKLKANYPSLAFVFLGTVLAGVAFEKSFPPRKVEWALTGSLKHPGRKHVNWAQGYDLTLIPSTVIVKERMGDQGEFELVALIDEGKSIEQAFELLVFTHPEGSVRVPLKAEYDAYRHKGNSLITAATAHTRHFGKIPIETYQTSEDAR